MEITNTFDRVNDVSKLDGCNTRSVHYRWTIFEKSLAKIPRGAALDFGAGSLRESFDLTSRGFSVTSVDVDETQLQVYLKEYAWQSQPTIVTGLDPIDSLSKVSGQKFNVITCFDVLEHLEDPESCLRMLKSNLAPGAKLFVTVPNGRTLFELSFRADLILARLTGRKQRPGEPHLQRNSPARWKRIIANAGLHVNAHDMQIGFFVNTVAALVQIPIMLTCRLLRKIGVNADGAAIVRRVCNPSLMALLDRIDRRTKSVLNVLYGWNLFVIGNVADT